MGQVAVAAIAFLAGIAFAQVWPFVVRWVDRRAAVTVQTPKIEVGVRAKAANRGYAPSLKEGVDSQPLPYTPNPYRRIGIAERRRIAEMQSLAGPTHQAEVTANNARAMQ